MYANNLIYMEINIAHMFTDLGTTDKGRNFRTWEISSPQSNIKVTPLKWRMKHGLLGFPDKHDYSKRKITD